jgi:F0F1-type ATP synthase assembly protein I
MNGLGLNDPDEKPKDDAWTDEPRREEPIISSPYYTPETTEQSARRSGLAYSAGITFFASVAFMLLLGWGADIVLGSKPWGLVGGIVLGAIIGFVQFFRITGRIYNDPKGGPAEKPLMPPDDGPF